MRSTTVYSTGADCTGNNGEKNRVLTLSNTALTVQEGMLVYVSGLAISLSTDYTAEHKNTSTTITFLNRLWDNMEIIVFYYEIKKGISEDFSNGPLNEFGVNVTRTPVTMTTDFHGNKTYTDGADEIIEVIFSPYNKEYHLDKSGLTEAWNARIFTSTSITINKYDKITYDSKVYRVDKVVTRSFNGTDMFKVANLFLIENE